MALLIRPKYLLVYKTRRGRAQKRIGEKRREEKRKREKKKKKEEKKKRREEEMKSKKVWNYEFLYEFPYNCMASSLPQT